ncbi:MAG: SPOR domain-containing protein [Saprospiraceae bacterium]
MKIFKPLLSLLLLTLLANAMMAQAALKRANKQYELFAFAPAVESYKDVLSKNPNHLEANSKIADCYRMLNDLDKALPHYQAAVAQEGVEDIYRFQYGLTLQGLGRYDLAKSVFNDLANRSEAFRIRAKQFADACDFAKNNQDTPRFKITNEYANSPFTDFSPALFNDRVVFASFRTDIRSRDSRSAPSTGDVSANRLFITQRDKNGFLETPVTLHSGFGIGTNEAPLSYSADGKWVAFTKNNFSDGVRQIPASGMELTLYLAQVNANGDWTTAAPFPHNGSGFSTGYPSFSPDGKALFFASDRAGGYGGFDLYVSYQVGNTWSAPENLGQAVNSLGNEISPFFDGASLYFSSDYHKGFGGFDIFRAEESAGRWSTIYHGGAGLNSSSDDYGFSFDAGRNVGYFVSNRPGGKGKEDLYKVEKETDNIVIKVTDAATGKPISDASVDFTTCGDKAYQTNLNGVFNFQLLDNLNCSISIGKDGYLPKQVAITSLGLRQNRTLEVALTNVGSAYQGKIFNGNNGYALDDVKIIATNTKSNEANATKSDMKGEYFIALMPNSSYLLRYSKAGFQDVSFTFKTGDNDTRMIQNIELLPVGFSAGGGKTDPVPTPAETPQEAVATNTTSSGAITGGYAVQIASLTNDKTVTLSDYTAKAGAEGTVYMVEEGGRKKVRVGTFNTRDAAAAAQKNLRAKGFSGAFTVEESTRQAQTSEAPKQKPKEAPSQPAADELKGYMVRLATVSNLNNFNRGTVDDVGEITLVPKGNLTIILLSGFDTRDAAETALRKARNRGFPEAYVVTSEKGELKKVQ